jgi:hypothetical protein
MSDGHEFQNQKPMFLGRGMLQKLPRSLPDRALHSYNGAKFNPGGGDDLSDLEKYQEEMMRAMRRQSNFHHVEFPFTTTAQLILPATTRTYFMVQNISAASLLYVGFGIQPAAGSGVLIEAVNGWFEPFQVPQNDIWIVGNGAGTAQVLYAND